MSPNSWANKDRQTIWDRGNISQTIQISTVQLDTYLTQNNLKFFDLVTSRSQLISSNVI